MSHTTTIKNVNIKDVNALRAAVADLITAGVRCSLVENKAPRMYYPNQFQSSTGKKAAELCLDLPNSRYDVGFSLEKDGSYSPIFDEFRGEVQAQIGAKNAVPGADSAHRAIGQLLQHYQKHVAINAAVVAGYSVAGTETDAEGNIHLQIAC